MNTLLKYLKKNCQVFRAQLFLQFSGFIFILALDHGKLFHM